MLNNHWTSENSYVNVTTARSLTQHCKIDYIGGVSATPTVEGDVI